MPAPMRPEDFDNILDKAEDVKATRGTPAHDKAIAAAKAAVDKSNANQKADNRARILRDSAERRQAGRRK